MKKRLIFIGGPSACGKTTIARTLGQRLGLPWLSVDYIHDMALAIGDRGENPETFRIRDFTAEEFYETHTAEEAAVSEIKISHETWRGVQALVSAGFEGIIEGVAVLPELVKSLDTTKYDVHAIYLTNDNEDEILRVAMERGIWCPAHTYPDSVKPKEVDFVLAYNTLIKESAIQHGYPVVEVERSDQDLPKVLKALDLSN